MEIKKGKTIEGMLVKAMEFLEKSRKAGDIPEIERYEEHIATLLRVVKEQKLNISEKVLEAAKKAIS